MSTINLLPDDYIQRSCQRRANVMCLILFAVTMIAVVAAVVISERRTSGTRLLADQVDTAYEHALADIAKMREMEARRQDMLVKASAASALLERVPRSHLLGIIANALPNNTSIYKLELDTKRILAAPAATAKPAANKFEAIATAREAQSAGTVVAMEMLGLAGTDVEVARLITNLARNPLIASVDLVYSQERLIEKTPVREFQVHLELKSNADALDDTQVAAAGAVEAPSTADGAAGVKQ